MHELTGLGRFPIVSLGGSILIVMIAASLLGLALQRRLGRGGESRPEEAQAADVVGPIMSGVLALLGLLLGFTFALAVDRYETRRAMVLEEANAIGTVYLQAQLLGSEDRARLSGLLRRYTDNRAALARLQPADGHAALARGLKENDRMVAQLWSATAAAYDHVRTLPFSGAFVSSMNHLIDLDTSRRSSRTAQVPSEVFVVLLFYMLIAAAILGYQARSRTGIGFVCVLNLLVTMSLMLIIDIDRPTLGGIREVQQPMDMLQATMRAQPPGSFDRWRVPGDAARAD